MSLFLILSEIWSGGDRILSDCTPLDVCFNLRLNAKTPLVAAFMIVVTRVSKVNANGGVAYPVNFI